MQGVFYISFAGVRKNRERMTLSVKKESYERRNKNTGTEC